ncbi:MAG: caspase family protein [Candidatus Melainabacteria bacterium]|nr:caspase family protein [Candidatus Melainabacteria bacterium]
MNQIVGAQHGEGGETYYQFTGGPGEIVLTADGKTDLYPATMDVNCTDMGGKTLALLNFAANNSMRAATTKFQLLSTQPVLMQLRFYKDDRVRNFLYRVTLTGNVQLRNVTQNDATYNHVQRSVDQALANNSRMRPDRRNGYRQNANWAAAQNQISPEQEEVAALGAQAYARREADVQRIALARAQSEAKNQAYNPRWIQQQQVSQRKAQQAQFARASRGNYYSKIPVTTAPQILSSNQMPIQTPIQPPIQTPIQTPTQVAIAAPTQTQKIIIQDSTSVSPEETPIEDKWALVVGVSKFATPGLDLKYPAKDAKDFRDYLVNEANFKADHVKLFVDEEATKERILTELGDKWLPKRAHPNDLVVLYLSTHGSPSSLDGEGVNYLVMHNTDPQRLYATGLAVQDLAFALKSRVHAKRSLLIMDACHSGSAEAAKGLSRDKNINLDAFPIGTGQMVICSSKPDQVSWESKRYDNGVFTAQLLKALRTNSKNALSDAFKTMQDNVESEVLKDRGHVQTPVLKTKWQGRELILTIPPANPHTDSDQ